MDAAGLVLIRDRPSDPTGDPEVLMGRRHRKARFMPDVYVFPGGRVTAADRRPSGCPEALTPAPAGLDQATGRGLAVFARAALRETYEETGVLLGRPTAATQDTAAPGVWAAYRAAGLAPAFDALDLVARAITPTSSPIRFHTRFFVADGGLARGPDGGDGELEDVRWVPLSEVRRLPLPAEVTLLVLGEALTHWRNRGTPGRQDRRQAALLRWSGVTGRGFHRRDRAPLEA